MGRLIIDDTTIYELDEECMEQKKRKEKEAAAAKEMESGSKAFVRDRVKKRPAP